MKRRSVLGLCGAVPFLVGGSLAVSSEADRPAAVVKVAAPKTIDGDAADWADLKAEQVIAGADGEAARFKLAFDDQNLYALVQVQDDSPLRNNSQVLPELLKGGDAVGFCFSGCQPFHGHPVRILSSDHPLFIEHHQPGNEV